MVHGKELCFLLVWGRKDQSCIAEQPRGLWILQDTSYKGEAVTPYLFALSDFKGASLPGPLF